MEDGNFILTEVLLFVWEFPAHSQLNSPLRVSKSTDIFPTWGTVPSLTCASFDSLRIYERMNAFVQTLSSQPTSCSLFWCICAGSIGMVVSFQDAHRTGKCIAHRARIWVIKRERLAVNGLSSALPLERDRHYTSSSCALYRIAHRTSKGKKNDVKHSKFSHKVGVLSKKKKVYPSVTIVKKEREEKMWSVIECFSQVLESVSPEVSNQSSFKWKSSANIM